MVYQRITLPMEAADGSKLGTLSIGAEYKEAYRMDKDNLVSIVWREASLENVLQTESPGDSSPIEFIETPHGLIDTNILLLEETDYQFVFKSNIDLDEETGDIIFLELSQTCADNSVIINNWLLDEDKKIHRGTMNFASYVGKSFFDVRIGGLSSVKVPFEVRSKKIGYLDQYPIMIGDISEACMGLALDKSSPLYQDLQFSEKSRRIHYEDYMFLEHLFRPDNLPLAYERIRRQPYSRLGQVIDTVPTSLATSIDASSLIDIASGKGDFALVGTEQLDAIPHYHGYFPTSLVNYQSEEDIDVPENQLIKNLLLSVDYIINRLIMSSNLTDSYVKDRLYHFKEIVQSYLSDEWLADISTLQGFPSNSQVLRKKEGYSEMLRYYLSLDLSFKFRHKEFEESISGYNRRLSQLYEYWCYLELVKVLARVSNTTVKYDDLFQLSNDGWSIRLKKGFKSIKTFTIPLERRTIDVSLMYNRTFSKQAGRDGFRSYTFQFRPDYTLCVDGGDGAYLIHFDAKYRSDREISKNGEMDTDEPGDDRTYWEDDVCKMHAYKDAILKTEGAYVLYPGFGYTEIFQIEEDKEIPSVGALSLTPGKVEAERAGLEWFIKSLLTNH